MDTSDIQGGAPAETKPSPLELLAKRTTPITDVLYGSDHPSKAQKGRKAPPQKRAAAAGSLVGDLLDETTKRKLAALQGKLEARERMNTAKKGKK
jgi:hypothetical protein